MTGIAMFHVSPEQNRGSILAHGLQLLVREHENIARAPAVYLLETLEQAEDYAFWFALHHQKVIDIWQVDDVDPGGLQPDDYPDMRDYDSWKGFAPVEAERLHLVKTQPLPKNASEAPPFCSRVAPKAPSPRW